MIRRFSSSLLAGAAALALLAGAPTRSDAQAATVISGRVLGQTQAPIASAVIQVEGTRIVVKEV